MSQFAKLESDMKAQFTKMRRGVKQVFITKSGKIQILCKSELGAMSVKIDMLRLGRRDVTITSPNPYTSGCYVVEC
jgi:hypothetical protein